VKSAIPEFHPGFAQFSEPLQRPGEGAGICLGHGPGGGSAESGHYQLLDFARPNQPHQELHKGEILEQTLKVIESELAKKNIAVERNLEAFLPRILVDRDQLSQALLNLLLNALESMEGAGKIRISMESGGAEVLAISISDTGRGIPKEDLERVFEPFFSTKRKDGAGIGHRSPDCEPQRRSSGEPKDRGRPSGLPCRSDKKLSPRGTEDTEKLDSNAKPQIKSRKYSF
jgi:hypothetical protein